MRKDRSINLYLANCNQWPYQCNLISDQALFSQMALFGADSLLCEDGLLRCAPSGLESPTYHILGRQK